MSEQRSAGEGACVELNCAEHQFKGASITHSLSGTVFECMCGPLTETNMVDLERAATSGVPVVVVFPRSRLILSEIVFQRLDGLARIEGRVVDRSE